VEKGGRRISKIKVQKAKFEAFRLISAQNQRSRVWFKYDLKKKANCRALPGNPKY
jgi:hypothetical protein